MFTILRNAHVLSPEDMGRRDVLIAAGKIAAIEEHIELSGVPCAEIDLTGHILAPGLIDNHVHITGGGGEGGYATRTPEIQLSSITMAGVTTVCGLLGTDGTTRSMENLLAKARGLETEGISTYIYAGAYQLPTPTLTGSVRNDIILIDKCIGAGEIAVSDHRSAQPPQEAYNDVVAQARVGGMLSGKAGIVDFHIGDGKRCLEPLRRIVNETEIPYSNMLPTHINRNPYLFEDAIDYALAGGFVDVTSGVSPLTGPENSVKPAEAIRRLLDAGVPCRQILMSSDGNGSVPIFDEEGNNIGVGVADQSSLLAETRDFILQEGGNPSEALAIVTRNVADLLKLTGKGRIEVGYDADILVLNEDYELVHLFAKGRQMVRDGQAIVFGTFEGK